MRNTTTKIHLNTIYPGMYQSYFKMSETKGKKCSQNKGTTKEKGSSFSDPLSGALDGLDPLSQFASDPLSQIAAQVQLAPTVSSPL